MKATICSSVIVILAVLSAGCGSSSTSPSTTTTTTTTVPALATTSETFTGTLPVGGSIFYSFTVSQAGTVNATLVSIGGAGVPSTVLVRLGIGTPGDAGCTSTNALVIKAGSTAQVTASQQPGLFCVFLADVGNLFAAADFTLTVDHP
jgi:hypothetical protein